MKLQILYEVDLTFTLVVFVLISDTSLISLDILHKPMVFANIVNFCLNF